MSGRRILKAIIAGETNAMRLTELGSTRLKCSRSELAAALDGRVTTHHRFLIDHHLGLIEELERHISAFDARIGEVLAPFRDTVERLITTPGVGRGAAEVILRRDRSRHERVPDCRPSIVVGWRRAAARRECRQAPFHAGAPRRALAQTRARPMCLGRCACEGNISAGAVLPSQGAAGAEESGHRRRGLNSHGRLPHAERRHLLSGSRRRLSRQARSRPGRLPSSPVA